MKTFTLLHGIIALFATSIAGATTHVVKSGDNLYRIARTYNVSLSALQQANPGVNAQSLNVGRQITIPKTTTPAAKQSAPKPESRPVASGTYTVVAGDNLNKIARSQGTTVSALQAANPKLDATALQVGQKINLSGKAATAVAKAPTAKTPSPSVASTTSQRSTSSHVEAREKSNTPTTNKNAVASSTVVKETVSQQPAKNKDIAEVEKTPANTPAASLTANNTQPISHQKNAEPAAISYVLIKTTREQTLAEVAAEHATTPEKLNALNGWSFSPQTLLAVDSELYVPAQP